MGYDEYLLKHYHINSCVLDLCKDAEKRVKPLFDEIESIYELNQVKVLHAMHENKLSDYHFAASTGYGYNDPGRGVLESIYANVFGTEAALVRPQMISGTHALSVAMFGNLRYGDELISVSGKPYDTLAGVIGIRETRGSLAEHGVCYKQVDMLKDSPYIDFDGIAKAISPKTKMIAIQRSKGYEPRPSLTFDIIAQTISFIKKINPRIICLVDNCYGEFVETLEPGDAGADLIVGSLIKNPGGGLAPGGGYIAGKAEYVENSAFCLTAPGLGGEIGPMLGTTRAMLQGLFLAPQTVCASLKSAVLASAVFESLGYKVLPDSISKRADIVTAIFLENAENVIAFCEGIQKAAPIDSFVVPEPAELPGYDCPVIMACGAFVQGSSIELSADAPIKPPYIVYLQGGLTWAHAKTGLIIAIDNMYKKNLLRI